MVFKDSEYVHKGALKRLEDYFHQDECRVLHYWSKGQTYFFVIKFKFDILFFRVFKYYEVWMLADDGSMGISEL